MVSSDYTCIEIFLKNLIRNFLSLAVLSVSYFRCLVNFDRSQWPRGLRHEPSSPARTLGSWVRISLEARMSLRLFCVCVVWCVDSDLATG
jgi:hypothetical protein